MRGIVFREGLRAGVLPPSLRTAVARTYPYMLDRRIPVEVIELTVPDREALAVAMQLAQHLLPERYYAHVVGETRMYVAFPGCVALIARDDAEAAQRAQRIGQGFSIPLRQMRFIEMFDNDHPDAAAPTTLPRRTS